MVDRIEGTLDVGGARSALALRRAPPYRLALSRFVRYTREGAETAARDGRRVPSAP
jgi:hypothetical protein